MMLLPDVTALLGHHFTLRTFSAQSSQLNSSHDCRHWPMSFWLQSNVISEPLHSEQPKALFVHLRINMLSLFPQMLTLFPTFLRDRRLWRNLWVAWKGTSTLPPVEEGRLQSSQEPSLKTEIFTSCCPWLDITLTGSRQPTPSLCYFPFIRSPSVVGCRTSSVPRLFNDLSQQQTCFLESTSCSQSWHLPSLTYLGQKYGLMF